VMILPARLATALARSLRLAVFEPPSEVPGFEMAMFWHDRHDSDPAHAFVREEIARAAASLPALPRSSRSRSSKRGLRAHDRGALLR
jgi:hypothetical protein